MAERLEFGTGDRDARSERTGDNTGRVPWKTKGMPGQQDNGREPDRRGRWIR